MNATRTFLSLLVLSTPVAVACSPGGQSMPMAATPAQSNQPDTRSPTERDPNLHVSGPADASAPSAAEPQTPMQESDSDDMAAQMKELGDQMTAMGAKMQRRSPAMKGDSKMAHGKQPPGGGMGVDSATMKEMGVKMKEMGARMRGKGQAMKGDATATTAKPAAGGMPGMAPGKMMEMGDEMMAMGDQMMGMGGGTDAMEPTKMKQMGDHMMEMGGDMDGMGKQKGAPMKKPMATPAPAPAQPPAAPMAPMPHM